MHADAASEADTRSDIVVSPIVLSSVIFEPSDSIDPLLAGLADHLTHKRWAVAGLVQETVVRSDASCCPATYVRNLTDGSRTRISVDRGKNASGCRLDPNALTEAAENVEGALRSGAQILIVNRFGQSESAGWGLRGTIELGIELGLPIIVGVRRAYVVPWNAFHGGLATSLRFDKGAVTNWALKALEMKL